MRVVTKRTNEIKEVNRTVYVEVLGNNMITYRITESTILIEGEEKHTYGVEIESNLNGKTVKESITDFSPSLSEVVEFTEKLIRNSVLPASLYDIALDYLGTCI
ncbi:MAG: hypothetical protein GX286_04550 [Clostridiales bacterium]|nr:hypothetical protein [Clostridiales bacterium]